MDVVLITVVCLLGTLGGLLTMWVHELHKSVAQLQDEYIKDKEQLINNLVKELEAKNLVN